MEVIDYETGVRRWRVRTGPYSTLAWTAGGLVWTGGLGGGLLDEDGNQVASVPAAHTLAVAPGGKQVALGGNYERVVFLDTTTGKSSGMPIVSEGIASVAFDPAGTRVATGDEDCVVATWQVDAPATPIASFDPWKTAEPSVRDDQERYANSLGDCLHSSESAADWVGFAPDGELRSISRGVLWHHGPSTVPPVMAPRNEYWSTAADPTGSVFAISLVYKPWGVFLVDIATGKAKHLPLGVTNAVSWSGDGRMFAVVTGEDAISLVDAHTGRVTKKLSIPAPTWCRSTAFASRADRLITACQNGSAHIYDVAAGTLVASLDTGFKSEDKSRDRDITGWSNRSAWRTRRHLVRVARRRQATARRRACASRCDQSTRVLTRREAPRLRFRRFDSRRMGRRSAGRARVVSGGSSNQTPRMHRVVRRRREQSCRLCRRRRL